MARSRKNRHAGHSYFSLYNVVAGRHRREAPDPTRTSRSRLTERPLAPDEYMLKRWRRLQLYPFEEHPDLPDSSLVMAIHWYIAKRAAALGPQAYGTMDATALLAIAVEVEEQMNAALGTYGHLAYAQKKKPDVEEPELDFSDTEAEEEADEIREEGQRAAAATAEAETANVNTGGSSSVEASPRSTDESSSDTSASHDDSDLAGSLHSHPSRH